MRGPLTYLCKYHQQKNAKEELKSDIIILSNPNDDISSEHSYDSQEEEGDFNFENDTNTSYDVMQNQKIFKQVKTKKQLTRKKKQIVNGFEIKKKILLNLNEQGELLEKMLIMQKNQVLSKYEKKVLKIVCKKGIDEKYRRHLWLRASGASSAMILPENKGYYKKLKKMALEYPNPSFNQIELDLRRTFTELKVAKSERLIVKLKNVLFTYCKRNPTIGYCQGMNFLVGRLLKVI